jgi:N-methylhydantoinase A
VPGPACYGLGGDEATVTDANLLLGYLNPRELAGGALTLHPELARAALQKVAQALGIAIEDAAYGVHVVANAAMIRAIKAVTTYRGRDPRDFSLLAFGGGGPFHAVAIARDLGISRVIVPPNPGVFSAFGLLQAPPEAHTVQTFVRRTAHIDPEELFGVYRELEERARKMLVRDGYRDDEIQITRHADLRYVGQAYELTVPADGKVVDEQAIRQLEERFAQEHQRAYGHRAETEPIEFVNLRVVASVAIRHPSGQSPRGTRPFAFRDTNSEQRTANSEQRMAFFNNRWMPTPVVGRGELSDQPTDGPLIIEDYDSTTVVPPGCRVRLEESGCLFVIVDSRP